jgi:catechol 2,3-dioxygenase-like lactoylglutathione lyase family enzyme
MPGSRRTVAKLDLNHLHLHVKNLNRARRFYESYFQFGEHMRYGDILFLRNADGFELALVPDRKPAALPDWFHFGFRLADSTAVRKLHGRMSSAGVLINEVEDHKGYVTFRCFDPDGYSIEIYCA